MTEAKRAARWKMPAPLWIGGAVIAVAGLAAVGAWSWLQGDGGRHWVAGRLAAAASRPGAAVSIGGVEGQVPFAMTLTDVAVSDHKGRWLIVRRAGLALDGGALLAGRLDLLDLAIDRLDMPRPPLPDPETAQESPSPPPAAAPVPAPPEREPLISLPRLALPAVIVHRLVIDEVALGAAVLGGEPALLHAEGHARLGERHRPQRADFDLTRRDGQPGGGHLKLNYEPDGDRLDLDFGFSEPAGGVLARALRLRDLPALDFTAAGSAPLSDWRGRLTSKAGNRTALTGEATVRRASGGYLITVRGGGDPSALLQPTWATLVGKAPTLALNILADDEGGLSLRTGSSIAIAAGVLAGAGKLDPDANRLTLAFTAKPSGPALVAAGVLPAKSRWRSAVIEGRLDGAPAAPAFSLDLKGADLEGGGLSARAVTARLDSTPGGGGSTLKLEAAVDYLTGADPTITRLVGPHAQMTANGATGRDGDTVRLNTVAVTVAAGKLAGSGALSRRDGRFRGEGRFTVDHLTRLLGPLGVPLAGIADLDVTVSGGRDGARFGVSGTASNLGTEVAALDAALAETVGDGVRIRGAITLDERGGLHARDWRLDGRLLSATGQADLVNRRLEAGIQAGLPHLTALAAPLGLGSLGGAATLDAHLRGPLGAIEGKGALTVTGLEVDGRPLGRSDLEITAGGPPGKPRASLKLRGADGVADLEPVTASAILALGADGKALEVSALSVSQGDNRIAGNARLTLDGSDLSGHLAGQLPDLEALEPLTGLAVSGRGRFDLVAGRRGDRLSVMVAGGVNTVRLGEAAAAQIEARGAFTAASPNDLAAGRVVGSATLTAQAVKAGALQAATLTGSAETAPDKTSFQIAAPGPEGFDAAGTVSRDANTVKLILTRLSSRLGGAPMTLTRPATVSLGRDRVAIADLRLTGQGFKLGADGAIGPDGVKGVIEAKHVPLETLRLLEPSLPEGGRVDGALTLSGALADPRADITATFQDVGQAQAEAAGVAVGGLAGAVEAHWRAGRLTVEGDAHAGKGGADLRYSGEIPLALRLAPLRLEVPPGEGLRGAVKGTAELAAFDDLLASSGDRLAGTVAVDLTIGGTAAAPRLGGRLTVGDGRYENQALGGVIEHISAELSGAGQSFTLDRFTGRTANGGDVTVTGSARLGATPGEALDFHIIARKARLIQTDGATADMDADLTLAGTIREPRLAGAVQIQRADIRMPDQLPIDVVDLKVIEAGNHPTLAALGQPAQPVPGTAVAPPSSGAAALESVIDAPMPRRKPLPPGTVVQLSAPPAGKAKPAPPPGSPGLTVALTVTARNQVFVRGRGLDSEFSCALKVSGAPRAPVVKGTMTMLHGKLDILGKEFQFKHGAIDFAGATGDLNPDLDMVAEAKTTAVTAQAQLGGSLRAPRLSLTSVPSLPQDEVLARVLFDKPVSQLGALEAVQLADSASQLAGIGGSAGLVDRVRRTLGVDRLGLTSTNTGSLATGPKPTTAVEAGRYVGGDVYVGVQQGLTGDSGRAKVEVGITDGVQAEVGVGVRADPQVGVKVEWDY